MLSRCWSLHTSRFEEIITKVHSQFYLSALKSFGRPELHTKFKLLICETNSDEQKENSKHFL